jgi:hypothetical protein
MQSVRTKGLWLVVAGATLVAGIATAADSRFDEAESNISKAEALLKVAEIPKSKTSALAERHRKRALALLERAKQRIECAKDASDGKKVIICRDKDD